MLGYWSENKGFNEKQSCILCLSVFGYLFGSKFNAWPKKVTPNVFGDIFINNKNSCCQLTIWLNLNY